MVKRGERVAGWEGDGPQPARDAPDDGGPREDATTGSGVATSPALPVAVSPVSAVGLRFAVDLAHLRTLHPPPSLVWRSIHTRWWTHEIADVSRYLGQPRDPRGSVVEVGCDFEGFLARAERLAAAGEFGPYGIRTFLAAHSRNCRRGGEQWALTSWSLYDGILRHGLSIATIDASTCSTCAALHLSREVPPHRGCTCPNGCRCLFKVVTPS